jgi:ACS family hexuronate transporter-like MFS transporter
MSDDTPARSKSWRWGVCFLLLLATTINYMDRQLLSSSADRILKELKLNEEQYGDFELGFALAFAAGSLAFGMLADRLNVRWVYPVALVGWSAVGILTGLSRTYNELLLCRVALGFFEAGHWPCALKTVQRILEPKDRGMGNGILQSGGATGAIVTPLILQAMLSAGYGWRQPFLVIGATGTLWAILWLSVIRSRDFAVPPPETKIGGSSAEEPEFMTVVFTGRFLALVIMVSLINVTWQLLRAWLPLFLMRGRSYPEAQMNYFTSAYYIATGVGVLLAGFVTLRLARAGLTVHKSRCLVFLAGSLLTLLATAAAFLPQGWMLLGALLLVGVGALAVFPSYYAFAQEISVKHTGKVNGLLGVCAWVTSAAVQKAFGRHVKETGSYDIGIALVGWAPFLALAILVILWKRDSDDRRLA